MTTRAARSIAFAPFVALAVPAALAVAGCLLVRPEPASLIAPLLGPWAGLAYGHSDCTLGNQVPAWSWLSGVALVCSVPTAIQLQRSERAAVRRTALATVVLLGFQWFAMAWLSAVNTTS